MKVFFTLKIENQFLSGKTVEKWFQNISFGTVILIISIKNSEKLFMNFKHQRTQFYHPMNISEEIEKE